MMESTPRRCSSLATARPDRPVPITTAAVRSIPPDIGMLDTAGSSSNGASRGADAPDSVLKHESRFSNASKNT